MPTYKLTVEATEPNTEFDKQVEQYQQTRRGNNYFNEKLPPYPSAQIVRTTLTVELTEAQWHAVRDAAVGGWA